MVRLIIMILCVIINFTASSYTIAEEINQLKTTHSTKITPKHHLKKHKQKHNKHVVTQNHELNLISIAVDANSGQILHANRIDELRHPASLAKVMTLYILFQELETKRICKDSLLVVSRRSANMAPSKLGLKPNETIIVEDAIQALVTKSANDVASTIAENLNQTEIIFAERMTLTARQIGMSNTTFKSASGLPNKNEWTTARDMAILSLRIQKDFPQYYHYFSIKSFNYKGKSIITHNKLLGKYEGVDGIKTGYTTAAGFNLTTSAKRDNKRLVAVVMGASSISSRNNYMVKLLDESFLQCK